MSCTTQARLSGSAIQTAPISLVFFQSQHTTNYTYLAAERRPA
ncbi:MAG: hypothetical protein ACRDRJ_52440 [Streptosporangiaceae bacterium]